MQTFENSVNLQVSKTIKSICNQSCEFENSVNLQVSKTEESGYGTPVEFENSVNLQVSKTLTASVYDTAPV